RTSPRAPPRSTATSRGSASLPAHRPRLLARADHARRDPRHDSIGRHVPGHHGARSHDRVVADRDTAQDARAVADPDVVADPNVTLVDPLEADRAVGLD